MTIITKNAMQSFCLISDPIPSFAAFGIYAVVTAAAVGEHHQLAEAPDGR